VGVGGRSVGVEVGGGGWKGVGEATGAGRLGDGNRGGAGVRRGKVEVGKLQAKLPSIKDSNKIKRG